MSHLSLALYEMNSLDEYYQYKRFENSNLKNNVHLAATFMFMHFYSLI